VLFTGLGDSRGDLKDTKKDLDIEVGGIAENRADALRLSLHVDFLYLTGFEGRIVGSDGRWVFGQCRGESGAGGLEGRSGERGCHGRKRLSRAESAPSLSCSSMDPFHAKVVAAATGSTLTALTSQSLP